MSSQSILNTLSLRMNSAASLFLQGKFADSLEAVEAALGHATGPASKERRIALTRNAANCYYGNSKHHIINPLCNAIYKELGMFRRCVQLCEGLKVEVQYLDCQTAILLTKAFYRLGKSEAAVAAATEGLQSVRDIDNLSAVAELSRLAGGVPDNTCADASVPAPPLPENGVETTPIPDTKSSALLSNNPLSSLVEKYMGDKKGQVPKHLVRMVLAELQFSTGDQAIDTAIVLGNAQMNYGNVQAAMEIFIDILNVNDTAFAAHLGLGSALALCSQFDDAIDRFTRAIAIDPTVRYSM